MIRKEGIGWCLYIDSTKTNFPVVIGGECSSVQLTFQEWNSLVPLIIDLIENFKEHQNKFIQDESIVLEIEKESWRACLEAFKDSWSLKLVLKENTLNLRGFEMYWPIQSAQDFVSAMRSVWDSR